MVVLANFNLFDVRFLGVNFPAVAADRLRDELPTWAMAPPPIPPNRAAAAGLAAMLKTAVANNMQTVFLKCANIGTSLASLGTLVLHPSRYH
jgi:hypothetical protein